MLMCERVLVLLNEENREAQRTHNTLQTEQIRWRGDQMKSRSDEEQIRWRADQMFWPHTFALIAFLIISDVCSEYLTYYYLVTCFLKILKLSSFHFSKIFKNRLTFFSKYSTFHGKHFKMFSGEAWPAHVYFMYLYHIQYTVPGFVYISTYFLLF